MTGDQHYHAAERLIELVQKQVESPELRAEFLAEAQVHATLALAAAKAIGLNLAGYGSERSAP